MLNSSSRYLGQDSGLDIAWVNKILENANRISASGAMATWCVLLTAGKILAATNICVVQHLGLILTAPFPSGGRT
jgi:hypothetical protein